VLTVIVVAAPALLATAIGVASGYFGGVVDTVTQRLVDAMIAFPGLVLILMVVSILGSGPISVQVPPDADPLTQIYHLILPSLPLVLVLFGYIARITRAGMIEALESDYTRTAVLKGLPWRTVVIRHVLRNALMPTIAVVATQTGYLIGGLVVIETMFNYQGIGQLLFTAVSQKDFPLIQAGVMTVGIVYLGATLLADISYSLLNPRIRLAGRE